MKASSRLKQLQRYKGNWATVEIMKTLIKNRRTYRNRIGSLDQHDEDNMMKDINGEEGEGAHEKEDEDDWDEMYMDTEKGIDKENGIGSEDEDGNGEDEINGGEDGNRGKEINGGGDGYEDDEEEFARNDDEGRNGEGSCSAKQPRTKRRLTQDDEPATSTGSKRKKMDGSGGHQVPTQSTKKAPPKRKTSKK